jgi:hypothetical protein
MIGSYEESKHVYLAETTGRVEISDLLHRVGAEFDF